MLIRIKNFIHSNINCNQITVDDDYIDAHLDIAIYTIGTLLKSNMINKIKQNDFVKDVIKWQKERKLDEKPYKTENELSFIFEELLELCLNKKSEDVREEAILLTKKFLSENNVEPEDFVDIYDDTMLELEFFDIRYDIDCLKNEVLKELNSRTGSFINGKWVKDKNVKTYRADFSKCKKD